MKKSLLKTGDGSYTLHIPEWDEQYHSKHGAIAEALHVFIKEGLHYWTNTNTASEIAIMEIGFGTGLNCFLSLLECEKEHVTIHYTGIEAFPLNVDIIQELNYALLLNESQKLFLQLHDYSWEENHIVSENFQLTKKKQFFSEISFKKCFNIIYFDAFGIRVQPELWTEAIFQKMYNSLKKEGVLVTYAANGKAFRAMQAVGFSVERIPGPPGKKEMIRAIKI